MSFIFKNIAVFFAIFLVGVGANAQFLSLHQYSQTYVDGRGVPVSYTGFRDQFSPTGTPGCVMGVTSLRSSCTYVSNGLSFSLQGGQDLTQFKVYVPAGATSFIFSGYLPQGLQAAVAVRMNAAPDRVNPLSAAEYANYQSNRDIYTVYSRLAAGQEVILVADGGGSFSLAGNNNFSPALSTGAWVYFRLINGTYIDTPRATYEIDLAKYIAGYGAITFGGDGDPVDGGSSGVPRTNTLSLSPTTLTVGTGTTSTITTDATTACSASRPDLVRINFADISLVAGQTVASSTSVTITCGTAQQTLIVSPAPVPTVPLTSFTVSPPSLVSSDTTTTVTLLPNAGAALPVNCKALDSANLPEPYVTVDNSTGVFTASTGFKLTPSALSRVKANEIVTIDCGGLKATFTIKMPMNIVKGTDSTPEKNLTFKFPFAPEGVAAGASADLYVLAYVPEIIVKPFGGVKDDLYVYQVAGNTWKPILFTDPEKNRSSAAVAELEVNAGLPEDLLKGLKVEIYVGYLPAGSTDFTKLKFIGDMPVTKFPGISPLWH